MVAPAVELPWRAPRRFARQALGLTVTSTAVRVVLVQHRDTIIHDDAEPIGSEETLSSALERLLQRVQQHAPSVWTRRTPTVGVAIDLPTSQVKTIRGLPTVDDARVLAQLVAATPDRFFIGPPHGIITTGTRVVAAGIAESVAFDRALLDAIHHTCAAVGWPVGVFVPASVALTYVVPTEVATTPAHVYSTELLAAYGATRVTRREPLAIRPTTPLASAGTHHHRPSVVAAIVAGVSLLIAAMTPAVLAVHASRTARRTIATLASARATALTTDRDVMSMATAIRTVEAFEQRRQSKTLLLAQLTQALPAGAVITTLTADTGGITVVALAPKAADVVQAIEEMLGSSHVVLLGPVTRDVAPTPTGTANPTGAVIPTEFERVTVHFRLAPEAGASRIPLRAGVAE